MIYLSAEILINVKTLNVTVLLYSVSHIAHFLKLTDLYYQSAVGVDDANVQNAKADMKPEMRVM